MNTTERTLTQAQKFEILHRDGFKCRYCGAAPGSQWLEVEHLIPVSHGGSDDHLNLVASCKKCNRGRSDQILFPHDMILGEDDQGWQIVKQWGIWTIKVSKVGAAVCGAVYGSKEPKSTAGGDLEYSFDINRVHKKDWEDHISAKRWRLPHRLEDFLSCLDFARRLIK